MQTSSTLFLLANFLAASVTAGISTLGRPTPKADLATPLQINIANQGTPALLTNRGSGRVDSEDGKSNQPPNATTAWRGSGRTQPDPDNDRADARLAWRGSGRIEEGDGVGSIASGRGSGRLYSNQQSIKFNA